MTCMIDLPLGVSFFNDIARDCRHDCRFPRSDFHLSGILEGLQILVLEDEFLIAMDVEQLCRDHGALDVAVARSLEEIADGLAFDAAIVDVLLGGVSTFDFAARLAVRQAFRIRLGLFGQCRGDEALSRRRHDRQTLFGKRSRRSRRGRLRPPPGVTPRLIPSPATRSRRGRNRPRRKSAVCPEAAYARG